MNKRILLGHIGASLLASTTVAMEPSDGEPIKVIQPKDIQEIEHSEIVLPYKRCPEIPEMILRTVFIEEKSNYINGKRLPKNKR